MKKVSFIAINIVLITLSILSIIYDYSIFAILTSLAMPVVYIFKYLNHIQKYPLNELREYRFRVLQDEFALYNEKDNCYYIKVYNCNGIYKATDCKKQMIFDMRKCIFPKSYLRAYFVRNIHFLILRKRKLSLRYLSKRLKVWDKFKYKNLKIVFIKGNKRKEYWIVKKGKTVLNLLVADIIGNVFTNMILMNKYSHCYDDCGYATYKKLTERYYAEIKKCCK